MARLTAAQRRKLPRSAFAIKGRKGQRSTWKYPLPTAAQARAAGISQAQRASMGRAAAAYSARRSTAGSPGRIRRVAASHGLGRRTTTRARTSSAGRRRRH